MLNDQLLKKCPITLETTRSGGSSSKIFSRVNILKKVKTKLEDIHWGRLIEPSKESGSSLLFSKSFLTDSFYDHFFSRVFWGHFGLIYEKKNMNQVFYKFQTLYENLVFRLQTFKKSCSSASNLKWLTSHIYGSHHFDTWSWPAEVCEYFAALLSPTLFITCCWPPPAQGVQLCLLFAKKKKGLMKATFKTINF